VIGLCHGTDLFVKTLTASLCLLVGCKDI